jgi:hypothetical protein
MKTLDIICTVLLLIGGLNWGLIGFFQFDLVAAIFGGQQSAFSRIIYALVGLSAVYDLVGMKAIQKRWRIQSKPVHA